MINPDRWIDLLSVRSIADLTPEEFKLWVIGLKQQGKGRKTKTIRLKKKRPPFSWKLTPKGRLSVTVTRSPKWISREELDQIAKESGFPENIVWTTVLHKKRKGANTIRLSSEEKEKSSTEPSSVDKTLV